MAWPPCWAHPRWSPGCDAGLVHLLQVHLLHPTRAIAPDKSRYYSEMMILRCLVVAVVLSACFHPQSAVVGPLEHPASHSAPAAVATEEEPFAPTSSAPRDLGSPPFRLQLVADPSPSSGVWRLVQLLQENLTRGGAFIIGPGQSTLRVGPEAATLYVPTSRGTHERSFPFRRRDADGRARALAAQLHRFYLGDSGPYFTRFAFVAGTGASPRSRHVFTVNFDGTGVRRVSDDYQPNLLPAWSGAGDLIYTAFVNRAPALVLRPVRGAVQILARERDLNTGAAFSPDGQQIAVSQSVDGNTDIYLLDRQGRVRRRLTDHLGIDISPTWSPAGDELVFVSDRGGSPQLHLLSLRDGGVRRLTTSGFYNQEPDWCPMRGSRQIVYTHRYNGRRYEVHLLDADSGQATPLTFDGGQNNGPSWSPDCRMVLYSASQTSLWMVSVDGTRRQRLYSGIARSPAWSPRLPEGWF